MLRPCIFYSITNCAVLVAVTLLVTINPAYAEDVVEEEQASHRKIEQPKIVKRPGDYARYRPAMKEICALIAQDGRQEFFYQMLLKLSPKDPDCLDCRPLLFTFAGACKPAVLADKRKPKVIEGEEPPPTPTPVPEIVKQRLPSIAVIDRVTDLSRRIAADEKLRVQTLPAVKRLEGALRSPEGKSIGEKEYCGIFADNWMYPWIDIIAMVENEKIRAAKEEKEANENEASKGFRNNDTSGLFD